MSVLFYPGSIRILGSDASGNNVMLCEMAVDDLANLPAANAYISDGYVLSMGCVATAINDNSKHRLNGSGNWVQIAAGTSTYTRAEIDALLSAIDAEIAENRAALAEVENKGAKNRIVFDGVGTGTSNVGTSYTSNGITFEVQSDGTVHVTGTISSGYSYCYFYTGTSRINIVDFFDGNHVLSGNPQNASSSTYRLWYKVGSHASVSIFDTSAVLPAITGETNAVLGMQVDAPKTNLDIIFKPMICTKEEWDISHAYEQYAPTNRQLYEMILQLQGG